MELLATGNQDSKYVSVKPTFQLLPVYQVISRELRERTASSSVYPDRTNLIDLFSHVAWVDRSRDLLGL